MFLKYFFLTVTGLCGGVGIAAGTFAFLLVIKVIPRVIQKAKLEHKIIFIETMVYRGIVFGTILSLFNWRKKWLFELLGNSILVLFGTSAGIFIGCISVALAEILDTFPIFFRRIGMKEERLRPLLFVMALGKMAGSLFFFLMGYGTVNN